MATSKEKHVSLDVIAQTIGDFLIKDKHLDQIIFQEDVWKLAEDILNLFAKEK